MRFYVLFSLSTLFASSVIASDIYVGGQIGKVDVNFDNDRSELGRLSDETVSYGVQAGYKFNDKWGVELGYRFGEDTSGRVMLANTFESITETYDIDLDTIYISGSREFPISNSISLFVKIGMEYWSLDTTFQSDDLFGGPDGPVSGSDDAFDLFYGVGASWRLSERVVLSINYERYDRDVTVPVASASESGYAMKNEADLYSMKTNFYF